MERASPFRADAAEDHLADAIMAEPHGFAEPRLHDDHPVVERRGEPALDLARRRVDRLAQDTKVGAPAQARHRLHDLS